MTQPSVPIRGIIFDLDGTLYVSDEFAATIQVATAGYIAALKGIPADQAGQLLAATRSRLREETGWAPTLSAACTALGGTIQGLHSYFQAQLNPETFLTRDERVVDLISRLAQRIPLYLFTNNNRALTDRILHLLGVTGMFRHIITVDDNWKGKPDKGLLDRILADAGLTPSEALFVGDRYDVDLRLPEQRGCPVYLSQSIEQLLRLEEILAGGV